MRQAGVVISEKQPPETALYIWEWFWDLSNSRGSSGFGYNPISYTELESWSKMCLTNPLDWEVRAIKAMDKSFIAETSKKKS